MFAAIVVSITKPTIGL